jgi:hypothetical protein
MRLDFRMTTLALVLLFGSALPCLWGQAISPAAPAREYIRVNGRVLAIEHLPPDGTVPSGLALSVKPASGSIPVGASLALKAEVTGATDPSVTWTFTPPLGSLVANGANATYTAPASAPPGAAVTVRATSVENPAKFATAIISVHQEATWGALPIQATFLNFYRDFDEELWAREFDEMAANDIRTVVVVSAGHLEPASGGVGGFGLSRDGLLYPSQHAVPGDPVTDRLAWLLNLADQRNMKVYVGSLQTYGPWKDGQELAALRAYNRLVVREILQQYGQHPSLAGWYFSQELWLNEVKVELAQTGQSIGVDVMRNFILDARAADPTRAVIAAPFFKELEVAGIPGLSPAELQAVTLAVLNQTGLDLLAPQDGIGAGDGAPTESTLGAYFEAFRAACDGATKPATLWSTVETFWNNGNLNNAAWPPAPRDRIARQIEKVRSSVGGYVEWIYGNDQSKRATYYPVEASRLQFELGSTLTPEQRPFRTKVPIASYAYDPQPSASYPDASANKLTDSAGGGYAANLDAWAGIPEVPPAGETDPHVARIVADLGQQHVLTGIRVLTLSWTDAGINHPASLTVQVSSDGVSWQDFGSVGTGSPNKPFFSIGWSEVNTPIPVEGRYIRLSFYHHGWMFISEVEAVRNEPPSTIVLLDPQSAAMESFWQREFHATVYGASSQTIFWSANPAGVGSVSAIAGDSSRGVYTAPGGVTAAMQLVQLKAAMENDPSTYGLAQISLRISAFPPPDVAPMSPNPGLGTSQTFRFEATLHSGGEPEYLKVMFTPDYSPTNQCMLHFARVGGVDTLWVSADDATQTSHTWAQSGVLGGVGTIQNSQCRVDLGTSSAERNGNTFALNLSVTAIGSWSGVKQALVAVKDGDWLTSWPYVGYWHIP